MKTRLAVQRMLAKVREAIDWEHGENSRGQQSDYPENAYAKGWLAALEWASGRGRAFVQRDAGTEGGR